MQDFIFIYIISIRGENIPYIYRADFEEVRPTDTIIVGTSTYAPRHTKTAILVTRIHRKSPTSSAFTLHQPLQTL